MHIYGSIIFSCEYMEKSVLTAKTMYCTCVLFFIKAAFLHKLFNLKHYIYPDKRVIFYTCYGNGQLGILFLPR